MQKSSARSRSSTTSIRSGCRRRNSSNASSSTYHPRNKVSITITLKQQRSHLDRRFRWPCWRMTKRKANPTKVTNHQNDHRLACRDPIWGRRNRSLRHPSSLGLSHALERSKLSKATGIQPSRSHKSNPSTAWASSQWKGWYPPHTSNRSSPPDHPSVPWLDSSRKTRSTNSSRSTSP
jgi:hypothetical protein